MAEINKKLKKIQVELEKAWSMLNIDEKTQQLRELEEIVNDPELWRLSLIHISEPTRL